ncbi:hypothetical protein BC834DRAFT_636184 [Gloeopeniophorella convolvens]|nr:hypothetical protein BC834DRAFT_636184 [Gloeopeniophorella convolvens]
MSYVQNETIKFVNTPERRPELQASESSFSGVRVKAAAWSASAQRCIRLRYSRSPSYGWRHIQLGSEATCSRIALVSSNWPFSSPCSIEAAGLTARLPSCRGGPSYSLVPSPHDHIRSEKQTFSFSRSIESTFIIRYTLARFRLVKALYCRSSRGPC